MIYFRHLYPFGGDLRKKLWQNALIGVFVAFFLIAFQPFNTSQWEVAHKWLYLVGYGAVCFVCSTIIHLWMFAFWDQEKLEKNWTTGREMILQLSTLSAIAIGNMIYSYLLGIAPCTFGTWIYWMGTVALVGVIPIGVSIMLQHERYQHLNQQKAAEMAAQLQQAQQNCSLPTDTAMLTFTADNEKETVSLPYETLLYVESADNYANFVYWENGALRRTLIRGTLKRFEEQLDGHPDILRCHRSFIVNLRQVTAISGNAQGYRLSFRHTETTVPVARQFGPSVLLRLKAWQNNM